MPHGPAIRNSNLEDLVKVITPSLLHYEGIFPLRNLWTDTLKWYEYTISSQHFIQKFLASLFNTFASIIFSVFIS